MIVLLAPGTAPAPNTSMIEMVSSVDALQRNVVGRPIVGVSQDVLFMNILGYESLRTKNESDRFLIVPVKNSLYGRAELRSDA